jgi:hypothetical protein
MSNLLLSTVLDCHGSRHWRSCGKLWVASLLRHQWDGLILIHRNFPEPLFPVERAGLKEMESVMMLGIGKDVDLKMMARRNQLEAAGMISSAEEFDWIVLADADCIALRNLDHLFVANSDLLVSRQDQNFDPGFVAVKGCRLKEFVASLKVFGGLTQTGLFALIRSGSWRFRDFERGEVFRPGGQDVSLPSLTSAAMIHFSGMKLNEKQRLAFGFHFMAVYGDGDGLFFDMMES